ncbi:MAG: hypothetical protein OGMRLDGQ_002018 [Candidatus Fervidibacter sp.]
MKERTVWLIFVSIPAFLLIFGVVAGLIVRLRDRPIKPQPLPLKTVEWKFPSKVNWIAPVDLDADGRSELLVEDENKRLWWAEWNGKKPSFEPVPIQTPSIVLRHPFWAWEKRTFIATELDPIFVDVKTDFVRIITRSENKWQTVRITAKPLVRKAINGVVGILDLDGDGSANDVLILSDFQTLEWWQRQRSGKLVRRDRLKLPKPYELYRLRTTLGWKSCALWLPGSIAFASMEKGSLLWKGESAQKFFWTDADVDGDGAKDRVEWVEWHNGKQELFVCFASGEVKALKLTERCNVAVRDLDDDGQAEIFVYDFTQVKRNQWRKELTLWRFDRKTRQWQCWSAEIPVKLSLLSGQFLFGMALDKHKRGEWRLLAVTERGNRLQVECWRLGETGWQSEIVAVLPKVNGEPYRSAAIWTGRDLLFVEDQNPKWCKTVREGISTLGQEIFKLVGWKTLADAPIIFLPHRIWGWHPEKRRWILLGHALSTPSNYEGHWTVTRIGSGNEVAIVWWSAPQKVHIGLFRNGVWRVGDIGEDFDHRNSRIVPLHDGSRHWVVLNEGEKFLAATIQ